MSTPAAVLTSIIAPQVVAEPITESGFFPVLLFATVGLLISVALLFSGLLIAPLESW